MPMLQFSLPWPPSVNRYWRHVGQKTLISKQGRTYKKLVAAICGQVGMRPLQGELFVSAVFYPPDSRVRDIDNYWKGLFDSLKGHAYFDDSQVRKQAGEWGETLKGGRVDIEIDAL